MFRTCTTLLLLAALIAPASAGDKKIDSAETKLDRLTETLDKFMKDTQKNFDGLKTELGDLRKDIDILKGKTVSHDAKIDRLEKLVKKLTTDLNAIKKTTTSFYPQEKNGFDEIRARLDNIEKGVAAMQNREVSVSRYGPTSARVLLVNMHPEELLFILNGQNYRVGGNSVTPIEGLPAGSLTYEVISPTWGRRALASTSIAPNQTFTLTAR